MGTAPNAGPEEISRFTLDPTVTDVPTNGLADMTLPAATVEDDIVVMTPTFSPAVVKAVWAAAWLNPTTLGTFTDPTDAIDTVIVLSSMFVAVSVAIARIVRDPIPPEMPENVAR